MPAPPARRAGVSGAIVAGGASERFGGEPKGLAIVGGARIIDRVATALRRVAEPIVLAANAPDASTWLAGVAVRADARPERGSVVGLHTALAGAAGLTAVVAWDMPFVSADLLAAVVDRAVATGRSVVPESDAGPEPFCAAYWPACLPAVEAAIARGEFRMSRVVASIPHVATLPAADVRRFGDPSRLFFNVNSPADLETAERMAAEG